MKKLIISLLLAVPLLTGCANIDTRVTLNDNKSASVVTSLTYQGNLSNPADITALNIVGNLDKFVDSGYKVDKAYNERLSTVTATKNVKNLKYNDLDLTSLGFKSNLKSNRFIELRKNLLITSYNIDLVYDPKEQQKRINQVSQASVATGTLVPEYYNKYADPSEVEAPANAEGFAAHLDEDTKRMAMQTVKEQEAKNNPSKGVEFSTSFSIRTPAFASMNNADSIEGTVYTWNIKKDSPTVIKLQYVRYSGFAIGVVLTLGVLLLVYFARKIIRRENQKRIDNLDQID